MNNWIILMSSQFKTIGIITKQWNQRSAGTLNRLAEYLLSKDVNIIAEERTGALIESNLKKVPKMELGGLCDLVIVVGGDGSFLHAARAVVDSGTPLVGINRGKLGFLTDIKPIELDTQLDAILAGNYQAEERFLLDASASNGIAYPALNDILIADKENAHMMEFEIYVNDCFMCSERADGLIVATPTGSTAYALSGGGPILHPNLNSIVLVPMFAHTLTSRPIVVPGDSEIRILMKNDPDSAAQLSADSQIREKLSHGEQVLIRKKEKRITLLHPCDYDYFTNIRSKLHWGQKLDLNAYE
jgi:NAD+ kinase